MKWKLVLSQFITFRTVISSYWRRGQSRNYYNILSWFQFVGTLHPPASFFVKRTLIIANRDSNCTITNKWEPRRRTYNNLLENLLIIEKKCSLSFSKSRVFFDSANEPGLYWTSLIGGLGVALERGCDGGLYGIWISLGSIIQCNCDNVIYDPWRIFIRNERV